MQESKYFFVFEYGFGSFGVAADTVQEARAVFRKSIEGDLDLSFSFPPQEAWKKASRKQRRTERFKESGIQIDSIEPQVYQN